jgi:general secretion pathway protein L
MNLPRRIAFGFSAWIDATAEALLALQKWFGSSRRLRLVEQADSSFAIEGGWRSLAKLLPGRSVTIRDGRIVASPGARRQNALRRCEVEFVLEPQRFMFRSLELPRRAADFLDGVVKARIDRLTPWSAAEAVFGWGTPAEIAGDRVRVTVAATARALVAPLVDAVVGEGAEWVTVLAKPQAQEAGSEFIRVYERKASGTIEFRKLRRLLAVLLAAMGLVAAAAIAAASFYGDELDTRRFDTARRIALRRAALDLGRSPVDPTGVGILEKHKREVPASVIVIDALSQILPDDAYLTELRILGDKLQIVGVARDPPGLIRLLEQSSHFSQATFFAPTTRAPSESREHFSIEAHLEPVYTPGP